MKDRLVEVVDEVVITGQNADEKMCSCESDVVDETCSSESYGACGDGRVDVKGKQIKGENAQKQRDFYYPGNQMPNGGNPFFCYLENKSTALFGKG